MIKGSMMYDQHGRKRKVKKLYASKKAKPNFAKQETQYICGLSWKTETF